MPPQFAWLLLSQGALDAAHRTAQGYALAGLSAE